MMKKTKKIKKITKVILNIGCKVLLTVILFIALLAIKSADWFLETFGEMDFSIVLYQLFSPMEGTSSDILYKYYSEVFRGVAGITGFVMITYIFCDIIFKKCFIKIRVVFGHKELQLLIGKKFYMICKGILLVTGIIVLSVFLVNKAVAVGLPEYIDEVTHSSTLFEDEYVDPKEVQIEFPENKRNLLLIYMESMESTYASVEAGGGKPINYIPELTELAEQNLNFSDSDKLGGAHVYTEGWTMAGLLGSSTGVPYKIPVEGNSAGEYETFLPGLTGLGDILQAEGYHNYFMCGSDAAFGGRKAFYSQHGNYEILDYKYAKASGIIPEDYEVYWGMEDEKLYSYAREELARIAADGEPFNFTLLTVDTHHPDGYMCELCDNQYPEQYANAIDCASKQAWNFVEWVKEQIWYENTTIVIVGDHTSMNKHFWDDIGNYERTIYNCFINYADSVGTGVNSNYREFSTLDMFPTILAAMGVQIEGERLGLGVNLFSGEQTLPEKLGKAVYIAEVRKYSNFYFNKFVVG